MVVSITLLVGAGCFLILNQKGFEKTREIFPKGEGMANIFSGDSQKDSDDDGLPDWQESLWRTNKNNSDTDGDGTKDGEEIKLGRDPLKKGPDDKLSPSLISDTAGGQEENTITAGFSRKMFGDYMSMTNSFDSKLSETDKTNLVNYWMSDLSSLQEEQKNEIFYKIGDLKISQDNSTEAIKKYGNKMGAIIGKYLKPILISEHELTVFQSSLEKENETELQKLGGRIDAYSGIIREGLSLEVPKDIASLHLSLINAFAGVADGLKKMKIIFEDPIAGMAGLDQYKESSFSFSVAINDLNGFFESKKIFFNKNEAGYIFKKIIEESL